jgi:moderate conductance mechanosensitive channel
VTLSSFDSERILSALVVIGVEAVLLVLVCGVLHIATKLILSRLVAWRSPSLKEWSTTAQLKARNILVAGFFALFAVVLLFNGWLLATGKDAQDYTLALITSITAETWRAMAIALGKVALAAVGLIIATRVLRRLLAIAERAINRYDHLKSNDESLARLFQGLDHLISNTAWMLLTVWALGWFGLPQSVSDLLLIAIRVYLLIAIGALVVRCTAIIVDTVHALSHRSSQKYGWTDYYDRLHPLLPTFRLCLEYALWIGIASLVLLQISAFRDVSFWGLRLVGAIAIFFAGRVLIEVGALEIRHRMLPDEGLADAERRRRATMVPLVRSGFTYAAYFGTAVMMLGALGFNPMPFLAGAGILGLVVGFGAQSLIDDVVSGFFILLENNYLVGDVIEVGPARGTVEAIDFRTTKIRDADGRLHVLRNGSIKPIINYSKDYAMAVVPVEVAYDADLRDVFNTLRHAGERLRTTNPDVLADTVVDGITTFGTSTMIVRTATRVKPGRHEAVATALRLQIKELFDRQAAGAPRKSLVPQTRAEPQGWPPAGQGV